VESDSIFNPLTFILLNYFVIKLLGEPTIETPHLYMQNPMSRKPTLHPVGIRILHILRLILE
jgi:hypothetical protein